MTKFADICINLTNSQLLNDADSVLARAREVGVDVHLLVGTDVQSSAESLALAKQFSTFSTAGVHPHDAAQIDGANWLGELAELAQQPEVVAIGETGLDFNRNYSPPEQQRACFNAQIDLAKQFAKPLFVHDRESKGAVLASLLANGAPERVVIHCFTGTSGELQAYLEQDFYIGITGWITDAKRGEELRQLVPLIPLQRLLIETDAPFLKPHNLPDELRSGRTNEPAFLPWIAAYIAELRGLTVEEVATVTRQNAIDLFDLQVT